jgi:hypothetical protein
MRSRGANARCYAHFETTYGTPPSGNYNRLPFVSSNLGEEQGLLDDDQLGQGREGFDPTLDVANNVGDHVVAVDARAFGNWLKLYFGNPVTTARAPASGTIPFTAQPAVNSTVTINGIVFTAKASGATGAQFNVGVDLTATLANLATVLTASADPAVTPATYTSDTAKLAITYDTNGIAGNAFTLAASGTSNGTPSGATLTGGTNAHVFTSGAGALPSMSVELAQPDVPSFGMNFGTRGDKMKISLSRKGLLSATLSLIAQGETIANSSGAGTPTSVEILRFAQATGAITQDGVQLAGVTGADLTYANNLDTVETIRPDGRIDDADAGESGASGTLTACFADMVLVNKATGRIPVALSFGWTVGAFSLTFSVPRAFLPKRKRPITGPKGVMVAYDWIGSGQDGNVCTATLVNDVSGY